MAKTYILLDSNILIRYASQGQPGCEVEHFKRVKRAIESGNATLLVPEIVRMESEKHIALIAQTMRSSISKAVKQLCEEAEKPRKDKPWNEIGDFLPALKDALNEWMERRANECHERGQQILEFIKDKGQFIEFTQEVWFRAKRRMFLDQSGSNTDADVCIIESISTYLGVAETDAQLLICTENQKDFGTTVDNTFVLKAALQQGLPLTKGFNNLKELAEFIDKHESVTAPTPEDLQRAAEIENEDAGKNDELVKKSLRYASNVVGLSKEYLRDQMRLRAEIDRGPALLSQILRTQAEMERAPALLNQILKTQAELERMPELIKKVLQTQRSSPPSATRIDDSDSDKESETTGSS